MRSCAKSMSLRLRFLVAGAASSRWFAFATIALSALLGFFAQEPRSVLAGQTIGSPAYLVRDEIKDIRDDLVPQIRSVQDQYLVPGLSLVVVRGQETLWAEGFGYADVAGRKPATAGTVYRAGSVAKPFTAIAVMQLEDAGQIDIEQPLRYYLPQLSIRSRFFASANPMTVRSVLSHHSGLPTDLNKGMWSDEPFTDVAANLREEYVAFPPNLVFSYSNLGFTLLGHLVQQVSGVPYAEYMEEKIFRPWGMNRTGMRLRPDMTVRMSKGYRDGKETELLPIRDLPAHGLYTSAADLGVFMGHALAADQDGHSHVLDRRTLREMFEPQNSDVALDLNVVIGLGWFLEYGTVTGASRVVRHGGTTLGFSAELILLPDQGLGVAVLANSQGSRPVVSQLAEEVLERILRGGTTPAAPELLRAKIKRKIDDAPPVGIAGSYATDLGLIAIRPTDGKICACIVEQTFSLIPYPDGWYGIDREDVSSLPSAVRPLGGMRFQTQRIDGREVIVARRGDKRVVLGEKVPPTPISDAWRKRIGAYELLNPDAEFPLIEPQLKLREGQLCMSYKMPLLSDKVIQVPLRPISDTEAVTLGLGRTRGETLRAFNVDGEERLRYSGFIGRKRSQ